ncbi:MAG: HlyD family efflux transporter periplasmic adaptor subunit [Clostridia bacterium]|nr:HlyD family efflux transporter periplasmic adaptor subunit [Lachnospiraceae bacterium]NCB99353.1 HlyD family efflux transporter periplasmic adaptor subunit [Clostridia bacterium]NCD01544.1 HlyD family efflux transporter periplasmic adaptor subunit [Clostridia bacterium]
MKKPLVIAVSLVAALGLIGGGAGIYNLVKNANTTVDVTSVSLMSIPYFGEENSSSGIVTTNLTQDVYITESQVIQEVLVKEGDTVSVGTPLMTMDNTLANLDLEMQALSIDNIDIQIAAANRDVELLQNAVIGVPQSEDSGGTVSIGKNDSTLLSSSGKFTADPDAIVDRLDEKTILFLKEGTRNIYTVKCSPETIITPEFLYRLKGLDPVTGQKVSEPIVVFLQIPSINKRIYLDGYTFEIPSDFHEMTLNEFMYAYNVQVSDMGSDTSSGPNPYDGITSEERDKQLTEKRNKLKSLDIDRREAVLKYEKMRKDVADATILSTVNGQVKAVGDPEKAIDATTPFITVTSQDGFYLKGTVNELKLTSIDIGQSVTITNAETGTTATAEITSISDYPVSDSSMSYGMNPNTSNYPFTAVISDASGFKNNQSVSVNIISSGDGSSSSIYIPRSYIREDNGEYYVFIADEKGRLKKQPIEAGAVLYGYYQEVKNGLTAEDLIAFPYGKNVKEGIKTNETDSPVLY